MQLSWCVVAASFNVDNIIIRQKCLLEIYIVCVSKSDDLVFFLTEKNKYVGWKRHTKQMKFGDLVGFKKSVNILVRWNRTFGNLEIRCPEVEIIYASLLAKCFI